MIEISVMSTLIALPPILFLIQLFRKADNCKKQGIDVNTSHLSERKVCGNYNANQTFSINSLSRLVKAGLYLRKQTSRVEIFEQTLESRQQRRLQMTSPVICCSLSATRV